MMKNKRKKENVFKDKDTKLIFSVIIITVSIIGILVFWANPDVFSLIFGKSNTSETALPSDSEVTVSASGKTPDHELNSDFDSYTYGMSMEQVSERCGTANTILKDSLEYDSVYFGFYRVDITFLFKNDKLYGAIYDVKGKLESTKLSESDYYELKSYLTEKYKSPEKSDDGKTFIYSGEKMYSRWRKDNSLIKLEITNIDKEISIVIGFINADEE